MSGYQQTIIVGNLGKDPRFNTVNGTDVANFPVAVNESWKDRDSGEKRERTVWFEVEAWGPQAGPCRDYLSKGRQVMVIGTVRADHWTDNDGNIRDTLRLRAQSVQFLSGRGDTSESYGGGDQNEAPVERNIPAPTGNAPSAVIG